MSAPEFTISDAVSVTFDEHRWYLNIQIWLSDGTRRDYVASADSGFTYGDGIWFGTKSEYDEVHQ